MHCIGVCLCREVSTGSALLSKARGDLVSVEKLCKGEAKATNGVHALVSALVKDAVPASGKAGFIQAGVGVAAWIDDLAKRLEHLTSVTKAGPKTGPDAPLLWLGGVFSPDSFVTASRQHVAGALSCSLDKLRCRSWSVLREGRAQRKAHQWRFRSPDSCSRDLAGATLAPRWPFPGTTTKP